MRRVERWAASGHAAEVRVWAFTVFTLLRPGSASDSCIGVHACPLAPLPVPHFFLFFIIL